MANISHFKYPFLVSIVCLSLIAGCFFKPSPPSPEEQTEKIVESITEGGYSAEHAHTAKLIHERWRHDGQVIDISILAPVEQGSYPLLLYVPSLGERADAGIIWRENWAKAGYFVLSIQTEEMANMLKDLAPIPFGPPENQDYDSNWFGNKKPNKADAVKNSELRYTGREYASLKNLTKRMAYIAWAYEQVRQKVIERHDSYRTADLTRLILAGYEFGAQTVAAMIGEQYETDLPKPDNFKPMAAILLSPWVDLSLGKVTTRYQNITLPILSITSQNDDDPYAMSTPQVFWENSSSGNKFQLLLKYANHQLLSGSHWSSLDRPSEDDMPNMPGQMPNFSQLRDSGGPGGSRPPMMGGMPLVSGGANGKQDARQLAAVISVSTAFLDNFAKSDNFSKSWLHNSVHKWLKKSGKLLTK